MEPLADQPSRAPELAKYQTMIAMFFAKHQLQLVLEYDRLFRQAAAQDPSLRWEAFKEDIYVWALTQHYNFRDRGSITSRLGPAPSEAKFPSDKATHTSAGKEILQTIQLQQM